MMRGRVSSGRRRFGLRIARVVVVVMASRVASVVVRSIMLM